MRKIMLYPLDAGDETQTIYFVSESEYSTHFEQYEINDEDNIFEVTDEEYNNLSSQELIKIYKDSI